MKPRFIYVSLGIALLIGCTAAGIWSTNRTDRWIKDYPDSPFAKAPPDAPSFIRRREKPQQSDTEAYSAYLKAEKAREEFTLNEGSEKDLTEAERKLLDAARSAKWILALEQSEAILRTHPDSIAAMYVYSVALSESSNPAAALRQCQALRRALHRRGRDNPTDVPTREWYGRCLMREADILSTLGRDEEALRCVELVEQVYGPLPWEKTWMLFRLNRLDEAEATIVATENTGNWKSLVTNNRGTLADLRFERTNAFKYFQELATDHPNDEIYTKNLAEASLQLFKFSDAEKLYEMAAKLSNRSTYATSHINVAQIQLNQGRFSDTLTTLKNAREQRDARTPSTWQFDQAALAQVSASTLMRLNRLVESERIFRNAVEAPDRHGTTSDDSDDRNLKAYLGYWDILQCRISQLREYEADERMLGKIQRHRTTLEWEAWALEQKILKLMTNERLIRTTFMPYFGASALPLLKIMPRGLAIASIQFAQSQETVSAATPYYDEYFAELAFLNNDWPSTIQFATKALTQLPTDAEKLLCSRLNLMIAVAELKSGHVAKAIELFDSVLESDPILLRQFNARIPVRIETDNSANAMRMSRLLANSPRFTTHEEGFRVHIRESKDQLSVEMLGPNGKVYAKGSSKVTVDNSSSAYSALYQMVHEQLVTPRVKLDNQMLNAVIGQSVGRLDREVMDDILKLATSNKGS